MTDSDLIQGLRKQDPAAVQYLSDCILPSVWRYVYVRVNSDQHLAEDIVSETVLALIRAAKAAESDDNAEIRNPAAWLRSVASNKVMDHFRAAARVQHLIDQVKQVAPICDTNDAARQQDLNERRIEIRDAMDQLPEHERLALEWKYVEKLSVREIAERMQSTQKAVESVLFRARGNLRDRILRADQNSELPKAPLNGKPKKTNGSNGSVHSKLIASSETQSVDSPVGKTSETKGEDPPDESPSGDVSSALPLNQTDEKQSKSERMTRS